MSLEYSFGLPELKPSLELADGIVHDLHNLHSVHNKPDTQWLIPATSRSHAQPDAAPHIQIHREDDNWKVVVIQRKLDKYNEHFQTKAQIYQRTADGLYLDQHVIEQKYIIPHASGFSIRDVDGDCVSEVLDHLTKEPLMPKMQALSGYAGELALRPGKSVDKRRRALQRGNFMTRIWERAYIGQSPDLGSF